jgi:hypothetical protein
VPSEWDRLIASHGGAAQTAHAGLVCAFTYHARLRGYTTAVCSDPNGAAAPDVLLERGGEKVYVEVEAASGGVERRLRKWRNQVTLQGKAAICATTPEVRTSLVNEARTAGAEHGLATDVQTLYETQEARDSPLWVVAW